MAAAEHNDTGSRESRREWLPWPGGLALTARAFPAISLLQRLATELDYDGAVVVGEHEGEDSYRQALPEHEQHLVIEF